MGRIPSSLALTAAWTALAAPAFAEAKKWTPVELPVRADEVVQWLGFSPHGKVVAALVRHYEPEVRGHQQEIALLDVEKRKEFQRLTGPKGNWVNTVQFSPDGLLLAVRCVGQPLSLWDVRSGKRLRGFEATRKIEHYLITPDGKLLVGRLARDQVKKADNYLLGVWDVSTGKRLRSIEPGDHGEIWAFSAAMDSEHVLIAHYHYPPSAWFEDPAELIRGRARVWNLRTGKDCGPVGQEMTWPCTELYSIPRSRLLCAVGAPARDEWRTEVSGWSILDREWCGRIAFSASGHATVLPDYRPRAPILARWNDPRLSRYTGDLCLVDPIKQQRFEAFEKAIGLKDVAGAALSANGEHLATWTTKKNASTVLLWNIKDLADEVRSRDKPANGEPKALWAALVAGEVQTVHQAMRSLSAAPDRGVALLREHLRPVEGERVDEKQVQRWIKELDDDAFEVREKATQSLGRLGTSVKAAIEKALKASPSPEMKRRLEELLASITEPPGSEELRQLRALDVLEQIGTPEARRLLRTLADGAAHAPLTQAARQALARLERRDKER